MVRRSSTNSGSSSSAASSSGCCPALLASAALSSSRQDLYLRPAPRSRGPSPTGEEPPPHRAKSSTSSTGPGAEDDDEMVLALSDGGLISPLAGGSPVSECYRQAIGSRADGRARRRGSTVMLMMVMPVVHSLRSSSLSSSGWAWPGVSCAVVHRCRRRRRWWCSRGPSSRPSCPPHHP